MNDPKARGSKCSFMYNKLRFLASSRLDFKKFRQPLKPRYFNGLKFFRTEKGSIYPWDIYLPLALREKGS
jgi:hypothetical protein